MIKIEIDDVKLMKMVMQGLDYKEMANEIIGRVKSEVTNAIIDDITSDLNSEREIILRDFKENNLNDLIKRIVKEAKDKLKNEKAIIDIIKGSNKFYDLLSESLWDILDEYIGTEGLNFSVQFNKSKTKAKKPAK